MTLFGRLGIFLSIALCLSLPAALSAEPYMVVMLPDTQHYSDSASRIVHFNAQTQWVMDNRAASNIVMVSHVGDIVQTGSDLAQWVRADAAMDTLDTDTNQTYSAVLGNHDHNGGLAADDDATNYITYFGASRYAGRPWYGDDSPDGRNHYHLFKGGGREYLHLVIEYYGASSANSNAAEIITWAQGVLDNHPTTPTILSTHEYLSGGGGRTAPGNDIFNALVADYPQVFMILCGHWHGESHSTVQNNSGSDVFQILADFQTRANGGDGWMPLFVFDESNDVINVTTYTPTYNQYETDANSQYDLAIDFDARFNLGGDGPLMATPAANAIENDGATLSCRLVNTNADNVTLVWAHADQGESSTGTWAAASGGGMFAFGATNEGAALSRVVTGLASDTRYYYRFLATGGGTSDWSVVDDFATGLTNRPAPSNVSAQAGTDAVGTKVDLSWTDSYATETGFTIQRAGDAGFSAANVFSAGANQTSFVDDSTETNTTYYYRVAAVGSTGTGPFSPGVAATTGDDPEPGLIAHWRFDEGSGLTAADSSGTGNTATSASGSWVGGVASNAFSQPRFTLADSSDLNMTGSVPFAISLWLKPNAAHGFTCLAGFEGTGDTGDIYALKTDGADKALLTPSGLVTPDTLMNYSAAGSNWVHVVGVHEPGVSSRIYIDGAKVATGSAGVIPARANVEFTMGTYWNGGYTYNGALDDVQVYNKALSDLDVIELYNNPGYVLGAVSAAPPMVVNRDPSDDATVMPPVSLTISFDVAVTNDASGAIVITNLTLGGAADSMSPSELAAAGATLTLSPASALVDSTDYAVLIDSNAIRSVASGLYFAGYTNVGSWNFSTTDPDTTGPALVPPFTPAAGATDVSRHTDLVARFDEPIVKGTGSIVITNLTDGGAATTIPVTDAQVAITGASNLTINPGVGLLSARDYAVLIESNAVKDAQENFFGGISGTTTWRFTTEAASLLGHWSFDEGSGTTAADASGNGNTATDIGATWVPGVSGTAVDDPRFSLADSSDLILVGSVPFTISFWVKPPDSSQSFTCYAGFEGYGQGNDSYAIKCDGSDKPQLTPSGTTAPDTIWHYSSAGTNWVHVVGVHEPGEGSRLYIDGAKVATGSAGAIPNPSDHDFVMGNYPGGTYGLDASLDDVQVYATALSDTDVRKLYQNPGYALVNVPAAGSVIMVH